VTEVWESVAARPRPALRAAVAGVSGYRQDGGAPGRHRGLPSPYLTVVLPLDRPLQVETGGRVRAFDALAGGLHTMQTPVLHEGRQAGVQLSLTPLGARALLGRPAAELAGTDVDAADVLGPGLDAVLAQLRGAATWAERFAVLGDWLAARLDGDAALAPEVAEAWRLTTASGGRVRVADVAAAVGWSPRHLRARLLAETGLTPKAAARVARLDRARRLLRARVGAGAPPELARLAAACGYADQAHLAREFRDLAGCPPSTWLAEEFPFVQAVAARRVPGSAA
jgi:AraC-like DNA-binding protein